jgi:hypothetical protein
MNLFSKLKEMFKKKSSEQKEEPKIEGIKNEVVQEESDFSLLLENLKIDKDNLALDRLLSIGETINAYSRGLIKNISVYKESKADPSMMQEMQHSISGKVRLITVNALELKNLVGNLEDHYYSPILNGLTQIEEKKSKKEIKEIFEENKKDMESMKRLDSELTKIIGYDELFNHNKNPKFKDEIDKEIEKRLFHNDLNNLIKTIVELITNRANSLVVKIEREDIHAKVRKLL